MAESFDLLSFLNTVSKPQEAAPGASEAPANPPPELPHSAAEAVAEHPEAAQGSVVDQRILGAAHSSAANAFAAAAGSGQPVSSHKSAFTPRGVVIPVQRKVVCGVMDNSTIQEEQLEVSPITMYNTEYNEERRRLVAVNQSYICYSLRQGHVRVLNKLSAARALHKAHTQAVTDLRFFSDDVNLIASAGKDCAVHVYRVSEAPDAESITISPIVTFREPEAADHAGAGGMMTVNWHPVLQDVVAYTSGSSVKVCSLEGRSEEVHEVTPGAALDGVAALEMGSPVCNSGFSPAGNMLAVATEDGHVHLWSLPDASSASAIVQALKASPEPASTFRPYGPENATRATWISLLPGVKGQVLFTAGPVDRDLCLWKIDDQGKAELVQQLVMEGPAGDDSFFNHIHLKPELQLVIIANTKANHVYTVHYTLQDDASQPIRFKYLAKFAVTMPILSMTATWNSPIADGAAETIQLYCVQTQAVQQYTLHPELCCPSDEALASASVAPMQPPTHQGLAAFRGPLKDLMGGENDVDAAEFASSAGFATAGSIVDPADVPEPEDAIDMAEEEARKPEDIIEGDEAEAHSNGIEEGSAGSLSTPSATETPSVAPKLLTPTELLATVRRSSKKGSADMLSEGSPTSPPKPALEAHPVADMDAAVHDEASSPEAPAAAAFTPEQPDVSVRGAKPDAQLGQVLAHLGGLQSTMVSMEATILARVEASTRRMEERMEATLAAKIAQATEDQKRAAAQAQAELAVANQKQMEELVRLIYGFLSNDLPKQLEATVLQQTGSMAMQLSEASRASLASELGNALAQHGVGGGSALSQQALETVVAEQVVPALDGPIKEGMAQCFQSTLLPGFESAVREMFQQLDSTVGAGLLQHAQSSQQQVMSTVMNSLGSTNSLLESVKNDVAQLSAKVQDSLHTGAADQPVAKGPMSLAEIEAAQDPTIKLAALVQAGKFEEAFTEALSLSSVPTVAWLCKQLDPAKVLAHPEDGGALLSQGVQLSLIQQLGSDLAADREAKLNWIQAACLVLNPQDPMFGPHMRGIVTAVIQNVKDMVEASRGTPEENQGRLVVHIAQAVLKACP